MYVFGLDIPLIELIILIFILLVILVLFILIWITKIINLEKIELLELRSIGLSKRKVSREVKEIEEGLRKEVLAWQIRHRRVDQRDETVTSVPV